MQDYLKFLMEGAEAKGDAEHYYRCRCRALGEYMDFAWFDEDERPHTIEDCDGFEEYEPEDKPGRPERPRAGKRERPALAVKDAANAGPNP